MKSEIEDKINKAKRVASDYDYLKDEFEGKLWGNSPDGAVTLISMIKFAKENDHILEHIIKLSKDI